jgi:hypothetical protein
LAVAGTTRDQLDKDHRHGCRWAHVSELALPDADGSAGREVEERHFTAVELLQAAGMMDDGEASFSNACGDSGG